MKRIALTGGIACGKSAFAGFLAGMGAEVLDTDEVVNALEGPGGGAVAAIVDAFGPDARAADGGVDRRWLGRRVFADPASRERLNAIVHPLVQRTMEAWLARPGGGVRVAVVPLLFEVGWDLAGWDAVVCVACGPETQTRRLGARGLAPDEIRGRLAAQLPLAEKTRRAGRVVWNDGSLDDLRREARRLMDEWMERPT